MSWRNFSGNDFSRLDSSPVRHGVVPECRANNAACVKAFRSGSAHLLREEPGCRRGVAVVEFAVVAPLFFLLILGLIEFGRMVMVQQVITNASREGARRAIIQGATTDDVVAVVQNYLVGGGVRSATVAVSPDPIDSAGYGDPVTVTVTVPFREVSWLPTPMFLGTVQLRAVTTMRREAIQ